MNGTEIWRQTYNYPILGPTYDDNGNKLSDGEHPHALNFKLQAQRVAIKSIAINNPKNLGVTVLVFGGPSDNPPPVFVCLPGKSGRVSVEGNFPLHIKFEAAGKDGKPLASGFIYFCVTSEAGPEIFSGDSVGIDGSVDIGTMPAIQIDPLSAPLAVNVLSLPASPPANSQEVNAFQEIAITSSSGKILLDPGPTVVGASFHLLGFSLNGFYRQPFIRWRLEAQGTAGGLNTLYTGWRDVTLQDAQAIVVLPYSRVENGIDINITNNGSVQGTLRVFVWLNGYYV